MPATLVPSNNGARLVGRHTSRRSLDIRLCQVEQVVGQLMANNNALIERDENLASQGNALATKLEALERRSFWLRLRWLVLGR